MGIKCRGSKVELDASEDAVGKMKQLVGSLTFGKIVEKIKKKGEDFEFYFMLFILGTFLCLTGSGLVSCKLLKLMASTNNNWANFD